MFDDPNVVLHCEKLINLSRNQSSGSGFLRSSERKGKRSDR